MDHRLPATAFVGLLIFSSFLDSSQAVDIYVGQKAKGQKALESIDHSKWDQLLRKYVDQNGRVNYGAWHRSTIDRGKLDEYLKALSTGKPAGSSRSGQLAFWINAYNAVTVRGILAVYPTSSIRNHTARLFGFNIWKNLFLYVDGQPYSLDQIEHEILRKMNEPRIHFAIVCASIGCPRLLNTAYLPQTISQQLEENAVDFFSRSQNFQYDSVNRIVRLSSLLSWFQEDFGANQNAMLKKIQNWVKNEAARQAIKSGDITVELIEYDWNLNDQKTANRKSGRQ